MKRDWIYLLLILLIMTVTSCMVEDSRAMQPQEPAVIEKAVKEVNKYIEDAYYFTYLKIPENKEIVVEEVIEEDIQEVDVAPAYEVVVEEEFFDEKMAEPIDEDPINPIDFEESYEPGLVYIGTYEVTAYEYTGSTCANGNYPTPYYTVACNSLPFGTELYLDGVGWVVVEDRGAEWHGDNWLDLYLGDVDACYEWGVRYLDVYVWG